MTKILTRKELDICIDKLKRRIADVEGLIDQSPEPSERAVATIQRYITDTVQECFGYNSPEHKDVQYSWIAIYKADVGVMSVSAGIPGTVRLLKVFISKLEEQRNELIKKEEVFDHTVLHPRISSACASLFKNEHYADAVFEASKALVNFIKERSGRRDLDGADLMRKVFSINDPVLAFNELKDKSDQAEQEGMMHLYEGAVLAVRDPRAHSFPSDSAQRALEYIGLLSLLANRLQETTLRKK